MPRYQQEPSPRDARLQRLALLQEAASRQDQVDAQQQSAMLGTMQGMFNMQQEQQLAPERLKQLQGANELQRYQTQVAASNAAWQEPGMQQKFAAGDAELQRGLSVQQQEAMKYGNMPTQLEQENRGREAAIAGQDVTNQTIREGKGADMAARMTAMYQAKQMFPNATPEQLDALMRGGPMSTAATASTGVQGEFGGGDETTPPPDPAAGPTIGSQFITNSGEALLDKFKFLASPGSWPSRALHKAFTTPAGNPYELPPLRWSNDPSKMHGAGGTW